MDSKVHYRGTFSVLRKQNCYCERIYAFKIASTNEKVCNLQQGQASVESLFLIFIISTEGKLLTHNNMQQNNILELLAIHLL